MAWDKLTRRERECAILLIGGEKTRDAARILGISPRTVEGHRARLLAKFSVRTLKQLRALDGRPAEFEEMRNTLIATHEDYEARSRLPMRRDGFLVDAMLFFVDKVLNQLVGATVVEVVCDYGVEAPWSHPSAGLVLNLRNGEKKFAWIQKDPEDNGMGWIQLEDLDPVSRARPG